MTDPLGLIGSSGVQPVRAVAPVGPPQPHDPNAPSFKDALIKSLREVDQLQQDATKAVEDFQTGRRDDLEGVILATQKAETAFKMLLSVRNKVMAAYEEIKQMRA